MSLTAVSCASSTACAALGEQDTDAGSGQEFDYQFVEFWNGRRWGDVYREAGGGGGLSCGSPNACLAIGETAQRWNGSRWSDVPIPFINDTSSSGLNAVSCTSQTSCEAVGNVFDNNGNESPFAVRWTS